MHLTVFGATGSVGSLVVDRALAAGHTVTAHTRDAAKVRQEHEHLRVVEGDVTDPADCRTALVGADAVIITLGNGRHGTVREAGTRAVVEAMHDVGVRRIICQSTLGVGASRDNLNLLWRYAMFGALLRQAYADHVRQEEVVTSSGLDWTIVRPSAFTDQAVEGVRHGFGTDARGLALKISRGQVADFLVAQLDEDGLLHRHVALSA
ncbi:SDR family oxidoreductase [Ornithinimicrobium sp. F0845]|uniref:NAD(P)-dependent oxidoreductase n=1 Tax=Ornithinimicrobium sp. F0845 TaxID=2926412 RepID=UPI001FF6CBBC|nr:SDR family oxidoreductase [Ornithinimicrobium sp. F0845]MCK0112858.1 SDR family oxidoreductase [Ornithinimicrobium sp. F0845]